MKIIVIEWNGIGNIDIIDSFHKVLNKSTAAQIETYEYKNDGKRRNAPVEADFKTKLREFSPDFVFSFNYFPFISTVCNELGVRYISWVYDSPHVALYSCTLINHCNEIFVFEPSIYAEFSAQGIKNIHYLPLACNVRRLDRMVLSAAERKTYQADISFVGATYTEHHNFYDRMQTHLDPYLRGYLEGIMRAQLQIDGVNFIEEVLTPTIIDKLHEAFPIEPNADGVETYAYLYAQYVINRKVTAIERTELLQNIAGKYTVDLYTKDPSFALMNVRNHGPVDYENQMPYVFKGSKINLNFSLRSIKDGIPLRCFDIMGSNGFLISNYQADLLQYFVPNEDFVYYESRQDLMDKIEWYLLHDEERMQIAENSHRKISQAHTFDIRVAQMLDICGIRY